MSTTFTCDHSSRRVFIVRRGVFTIDDLIDSVRRMRATNVWGYSVLVDAREASAELSPIESHQLVDRIGGIGDATERGAIAVVAADDLTFGMLRMFSSLAGSVGMRVRPFRDIAHAEFWLLQMSQGEQDPS
jgi:hypothetical protein